MQYRCREIFVARSDETKQAYIDRLGLASADYSYYCAESLDRYIFFIYELLQ